MNKEFQNKKHTQTRTGTHTKERNSESLRLKAPTHKQRAPGPNASDDALVVISEKVPFFPRRPGEGPASRFSSYHGRLRATLPGGSI